MGFNEGPLDTIACPGRDSLLLHAGDRPYVVGVTGHVESWEAHCRRRSSFVARSIANRGLKHPLAPLQDRRPATLGLVLSFAILRIIRQTTETAGPDPATYEEGQ